MLRESEQPRRSHGNERPTGLPELGRTPWGSHLCHFYRTTEDLVEILVPWFEAGLEANEQCLWVASKPFPAEAAAEALRQRLPNFDEYVAAGRILIVDEHGSYLDAGRLDAQKLLDSWLTREEEALRSGFEGLRLSGNTAWLQPDQWADFAAYEEAVHEAFHERRILALCSYSLDRCSLEDVLSVLQKHHMALIRERGSWQVIRSATALMATFERLRFPVRAPAGDHLVEFYLDQAYPAARAATFVTEGLAIGERVILILTRAHTALVYDELRQLGVDPEASVTCGDIVWFDAEEELERMLALGLTDKALRAGPVGDAVNALLARGTIRVYGEMVDLLCRRHRVLDAVRLEETWNELLIERPFPLLCTYGVSSFDHESTDALERVCAQHAHVRSSASSIPPKLLAELHHQQSALASESQRRRELEEERVRLFKAERTARERAHALGDQLSRLQRVTSALSEAATPEDIASVVVEEMREAVGADQAILVAPVAGTDELGLLGHSGLRRRTQVRFQRFPVSAPLPVAVAFRTGRAQWLGSACELRATFPDLVDPPEVVVALPLTLADRGIGALAFGFKEKRKLHPSFRALLEDLTRQAALALDRALLYQQAQRTRDRLQLLSDATAHFSQAGLDVAEVLDALAAEVTRGFADGCTVLLLEEGDDRLHPVTVRNTDAAAEIATLQTLARAPAVVGEGLAGTVALTGEPVRLDQVPAELLRGRPEAHRRHLSSHPVGPVLMVALRSSGRVLGVVSTSRSPGRTFFSHEDQELLQELADRAALSIDNARLYERAQADRARAEAANRAKDEFLAMLGHELRNPLSPIVTALQLMRLRGGQHFTTERAIMERQVKHMVRLVDDLLDVSRITRGKVEIRLAPIELSSVVADAIEVASPMLEERSHLLTVQVPSEGLVVEVDAHRLTQVVANLLTNAAKYTPNGGQITLVAAAECGHVHLAVRDNGIGIAPELLPTVFDTFVQDTQTIDRSRGGLGLGLAIVRALVDMHHGSVFAESAGSGKGSTFTIHLPLAPIRERHRSDPPSSTRRVLVVDDNRGAADVIALVLQDSGYETRVAYDGPGALDVLDGFTPDVALLDLGLPGMDGFELAEQLRARLGDKAPRIVAISGYGRPDDRERTQRAGFHAHLGKPVRAARLTEVLGEVLGEALVVAPG